MKKIKNLIALTLMLFFVSVCALNADAQRRRPAARKVSPVAAQNAAEIKDESVKVATQIKNLTKFIYLLGKIASNIEDTDKKSGGRRVQLNETNKQKVLTAIQNFHAGLAELETEFKSKPSLRLYNFQIQGISDLCAQSEDLAAAGRFTDAGNPLLSIVEKLSDTLVSLP